jgi:hypothetical protein
MGVDCAYEPKPGSVVATRPGWPVDCTVGYLDLGPPHDPDGVADRDILRPPGQGWSAARRRAMADLIAGELADLRGRTMEDYIETSQFDAYNMGDTDPSPPLARLIDMRTALDPADLARRHVDNAVAAAWSLAATTKPPPGSVRTRKAWPGKVRLVRANGEGWTLIGRTDRPVIVLVDEIPETPIDIDQTPRLDELLNALTAAADRT